MNTILIVAFLFIILIVLWSLFSGKAEAAAPEAARDEKAPEKTFRRRAIDKEIEEAFPDESDSAPPSPGMESSAPKMPPIMPRESDGSIRLPYQVDEIINDTSRFRLYKRTLMNSEVYAKKGDFTTAISLYEGVKSRINDAETKYKIGTNIDYLKNFKRKKEEDYKKRQEDAQKDLPPSNEIRLKIDGPVPSTINIGLPDHDKKFDPEDLADRISQQLKNEFNELKLQKNENMELRARMHRELEELKKIIKGNEETRIREKNEDDRQSENENPGEKFRDEIDGIKDRIQQLNQENNDLDNLKKRLQELNDDKERTKTELEILKEKTKEKTAEKQDDGEIDDLKEKIAAMNKKMDDIQNENERISRAARQSMNEQQLKIDTQPLVDLLEKITSENAKNTTDDKKSAKEKPAAAEAPAQKSREEKELIQKETAAEEDEDFELLKEYGKDKDSDTMTDDEIFEKILKDDKDDAKGFEILGEKKEEVNELGMSRGELAQKQKDDDKFYKNLLKTDRMKKKELPILKVSYDFTRLPDESSLSREQNILEYALYKYKPMFIRAEELIKKRKVRDAINYYKVIIDQNIPPEFKAMIRKNIGDLTDYLEKYLTAD